jgi:integrase
MPVRPQGRRAATRSALDREGRLAFLGLRRGELLGLRWDDGEIGAGEVRVSIERARTPVGGVVTEGR